jgi:hypothetical protein
VLKNSKNLPKKNTLGGLVFRSFLPHLTPDRDERRRREKEEEHATQRHTEDTRTLPLSITYKKTYTRKIKWAPRCNS